MVNDVMTTTKTILHFLDDDKSTDNIIIDHGNKPAIDEGLKNALMNITVMPPVHDDKDATKNGNNLDVLFDAILNDSRIRTQPQEQEPTPKKVVPAVHPVFHQPAEPPLTSLGSITTVGDLAALDPSASNDVIINNMIVENAVITLIEAKLQLLKNAEPNGNAMIAELDALLAEMMAGNKIGAAQKYHHIVTADFSRYSTQALSLRAFMHVIGEIYFSTEQLF